MEDKNSENQPKGDDLKVEELSGLYKRIDYKGKFSTKQHQEKRKKRKEARQSRKINYKNQKRK